MYGLHFDAHYIRSRRASPGPFAPTDALRRSTQLWRAGMMFRYPVATNRQVLPFRTKTPMQPTDSLQAVSGENFFIIIKAIA